MYTPENSSEEPVPVALIQAVVHSPDYNIDDPLCYELSALLSFKLDSFCQLDKEVLSEQPFPSFLKAEKVIMSHNGMTRFEWDFFSMERHFNQKFKKEKEEQQLLLNKLNNV